MIKFILIAGLPLIALGIIYPTCMVAFYPIYRSLGGRKSLTKYMKSI